MGVGRAHEAALERTLVEVVGEAALAAQQALVLNPRHLLPEPARQCLLPAWRGGAATGGGGVPAARRTARLIPA